MTYVSFEACMADRQNLLNQGREAGDKAWALVKALPGIQATSPEIRKLYAIADRLGKAASMIRCLRQSPSDTAARAVQGEVVGAIASNGLKRSDPFVRVYVSSLIRQVQQRSDATLKAFDTAAGRVQDDHGPAVTQPSPPAPVPTAPASPAQQPSDPGRPPDTLSSLASEQDLEDEIAAAERAQAERDQTLAQTDESFPSRRRDRDRRRPCRYDCIVNPHEVVRAHP